MCAAAAAAAKQRKIANGMVHTGFYAICIFSAAAFIGQAAASAVEPRHDAWQVRSVFICSLVPRLQAQLGQVS